MKTPFPINPTLTGIALAYQNGAFVADRVLPRVTVGGQLYKWNQYTTEERFTIPDTLTGRKGRVNEVEFTHSEKESSTKDYGLEDPIPMYDIEAARNSQFNPLGHATEMLTELILLDREKRVANMVMDPANFGAGYKEALTGTDVWTDPASQPLVQLADAIESTMMRCNVLTINGNAALALRRNPSVVKAFNGTTGSDGLVPLEFIREVLELDEIIVGRGKYNAANKGQAMNLNKVWGNHALLSYRNPQARPQGGITFGWTAQWGGRISGDWEDKNIGLRGGRRVRVGESVDEKLVATDVAYLLQDVI